MTNFPPARRPRWAGYALAGVLTLCAAGVKLAMGPLLGGDAPFLLMILPPIVAAWYGGLGPALTATGLAAALNAYFFIASPGSFRMGADEAAQLLAFAAEGALLAVWSIARDRSREALRAADQRAAAILESISDAFVALDADFRFSYVNHAAQSLMGKPRRELLGRSLWEMYPLLAGTVLEGELRRALSGRAPAATEFLSPGSKRWFDIRAYPAPEGGLSIYFRDITERKRAEDESRHLAAIVESSEDAIVSTSLKGAILTWNHAAENVYGYPAAEVAGKPIALLAPPGQDGEIAGMLQRLRDGVGVEHTESLHVRRDGTRVPVWMTVSPIRGAGGRVLAASLIIRDIAERKRFEQRMRDAQKLESLGVLAGGVAHDFNNLLTAILGNAALTAELLPSGHPARVTVEDILSAGERAADLTRQMLAYSGKGRFVNQRVDITALVLAIAGLVRSSIPHQAHLDLQLAEGLPPVMADPGQIQQLILNLAINAGEALGEEPGRVWVSTGAHVYDEQALRAERPSASLSPGRYVWLEVGDTGSGMNEETLSKLWDPFFTTKFTGRGLGLAAVSGIVRGHRGAIAVSSAPGRGSTFRVLLPAAAAGSESVGPPAAD